MGNVINLLKSSFVYCWCQNKLLNKNVKLCDTEKMWIKSWTILGNLMESWKELVSHIDWFINKSDEGGTTTMKDNDS